MLIYSKSRTVNLEDLLSVIDVREILFLYNEFIVKLRPGNELEISKVRYSHIPCLWHLDWFAS